MVKSNQINSDVEYGSIYNNKPGSKKSKSDLFPPFDLNLSQCGSEEQLWEQGTHRVVEVLDGELSEALVHQVQLAFGRNRFEPERKHTNSTQINTHVCEDTLKSRDPRHSHPDLVKL